MTLANQKCKACSGDVDPYGEDKILEYSAKINEDWDIVNNHHLKRTFDFPDFKTALEFVNKVGELAEEEGHHPNIEFTWGEVTIKIYTHKIDGLWESDFVLAAKIDELQK